MSKILITGGTGLVGSKLTKMLIKRDHNVVILSRNPKEKNEFKWDVSNKYIDKKALKNIDFIIHLAGAGIADKRWTKKRKEIIINSRVNSANLIYEYVNKLNIKLKGFISASGIGYYGAITSQIIFSENDDAGSDFLGEVCVKWENAAHQFSSLEIPVTILRTGIVLSKNGGALEKMKTPVITPLGSGNQYMPWIHIEDLCNMYIETVENNLQGIFNAVAPQHKTNKYFSKVLAKYAKKPFIGINAPTFALKLAFGDLSKILLEGSRISSKKIEKWGFTFRFSKLNEALKDLFSS